MAFYLFIFYFFQEHLSITRNNLKEMGYELGDLKSLRSLVFHHNQITDIGVPDTAFISSDLSVVVSKKFFFFFFFRWGGGRAGH